MTIAAMTSGVCGASSNVPGTPSKSISFAAASSQYLSMTSGNFGGYNHAKFAMSTWVKRASLSAGNSQRIMGQRNAFGSTASWDLSFSGSDTLNFESYSDGTSQDAILNTNATYTSTSAYYHILVYFDSANSTADSRVRIWVNGTEVSSFSFRQNPVGAVFNGSDNVTIGNIQNAGSYIDGLIYQLAFFSGSLPAIGSVYNAGHQVDISAVSGLYSILDCASGVVTHDGKLATAWTNNNTATVSSTIPT